MEGQPQLLKGINYGTFTFGTDRLIATKDNKTLLQIPLDKISNCSVVNKQDIALELQVDDIDNDDILCEMRFYIPSNAEKEEEKEEKEKEEGMEEEEDENKEERKTAAELLNEQIQARANVTEKAGDIIVTFDDLPFIVPRGKYSCDLSVDSLRMHGPTFNHIIRNKNITKAFLLPKPDDVHMFFVIELDKPVRQGNTSYHYMVMQIKKDVKHSCQLKIPPEQLEAKLNEKLKPEYEGNLHDVVARLFKSIIKVNIIIPGGFESSTKHSGVKCSIKASEGHLFFLTKSLIFVPKPVIYIKLDDLKGVEFHRLGSGTQIRLFDITLNLKNGQHSFSGIDKKELEIIMEYFNSRKIPVKTVNEFNNEVEDMSEEDEPAEGGRRKRKPVKGPVPELDDDDEDEEDDDFIAEDDDESDEEDEDFDEEEEEKPKKPSKKPTKK